MKSILRTILLTLAIAAGLTATVTLPAHALVDVVHPAAEGVHRAQQAHRLFVDALPLDREREAGPPAPAQG